MSEILTCTECSAPFSKATARFCSKCGAKRPSAPAPPSAPVQQQQTSSSPSQHAAAAPATTASSHVPSQITAPAVATPPQLSPSPPPFSSSGHTSAVGLTSSNDGTVPDMSEVADADAAAVFATLSPDGISPEMLQTANADGLRVWKRGSLLGRGTFGSVYLGLLPDGSFHAVKVVELGRKTGTFQPKELVSLSREISLMRRLQHKNLCSFRGAYYDTNDTSVCMFMEYIAGGSVSSLVKKFKPLPMEVVRSWTKQLLKGLLYLHSQRVIHRDIKGDNILIDTSCSVESESQVKLVDFGAAKRLTDAVSHSRTVVGTPYWMAPEIVDLTGEGDGYSYKADVWSTGCTVAEFITGKPPWPSKANIPAAIMMIGQSVDGPTEIPTVEECSAGCVDFMKKCFVRKPEDRPTVEELLQHPWILGEMP